MKHNFFLTWKPSIYIWRGRKPQFQASQNFHYFLKVGKIGYSFAMEKEKGETLEKREKEEVGEASIVARERWLINFSSLSPSFFYSGEGSDVSLSYRARCWLPKYVVKFWQNKTTCNWCFYVCVLVHVMHIMMLFW